MVGKEDVMQNGPCGVLIVNKHGGVTSHDMVGKVRRLYSTRAVGHTGTLDPLATGVLVVLIGRAAKAAEYLVSDTKEYRATLKLGMVTDTEDITGEVKARSDAIPTADEVFRACERFVGKSKQIPPMYSALKVGGRKLCDLAREGKVVEREARDIEIFSLVCTATDKNDEYIIDVKCSSGTYIRTLCADIGESLGCGGVMATLERRQTGGFDIQQAHSIAELEGMSEEKRLNCLLPTESLFSDLPEITLPEFYEKLARNGCEIYQKKIKTSFALGKRVRMISRSGVFYALGEVKAYGDETAIKIIKFFDL